MGDSVESVKARLTVARLHQSEVVRKLCTLVVAPLAGLGYVHWRFPTWFVNPPFQIDPWIYWGTGENLKYAKTNFSTTYYYRRWTLTLPNYFFQHILSPLHAQFALRSLLLLAFLVCIAAILWSATKSVVVVAFTIFAICSNEYFIHLVGRSYNEGTGVLFVTAGVGVIVWSINQRIRNQVLLFCIAGFLFGLSMVSYQFTAYIFTPLFFVVAFFKSEMKWIRSLIRNVLLATCAVGGFAGAIVLDLWVGRLIGTPWENLLTYSLRIDNGIRSQNSYSVARDVFVKQIVLNPGSYLVPTGVLLVTYVLTLSSKKMLPPLRCRILVRYSAALFFVFLVLPMLPRTANVVGYSNTNVYLLLALYFALALVAYRVLQLVETVPRSSPSSRDFFGLAILAVLIAGVVFSKLSESKETATALYWTAFIVPACTATMRWLASRWQERVRLLNSVLAVGLLAASFGVAETVESRWAYAQRPGFSSRETAGEFLQQLSTTTRRLTDIANEQSRRMWLVDTREHAGWSTNISVLYGNYSAATLGYPPPQINCDQLNWIVMFSNSSIVVLGETNRIKAKQLIQGLAKECPAINLDFRLVDQKSSSVWLDVGR